MSAHPNYFNPSKLSDHQKEILDGFKIRREKMQCFIEKHQLRVTVCPGCGFPALPKRWFHAICNVCNWQHDGQDDPEANEIWNGPNDDISLTEHRLLIGERLSHTAKISRSVVLENPKKIYEAVQNHNRKVNAFEENLTNAKANDPVWQTFEKLKNEIFEDLLVSKKNKPKGLFFGDILRTLFRKVKT